MCGSEQKVRFGGIGGSAIQQAKGADDNRRAACKFATIYIGTLLAEMRRLSSGHCLRDRKASRSRIRQNEVMQTRKQCIEGPHTVSQAVYRGAATHFSQAVRTYVQLPAKLVGSISPIPENACFCSRATRLKIAEMRKQSGCIGLQLSN